MAHPQIPDDITRVTEAELRADFTTFLNCVADAEAPHIRATLHYRLSERWRLVAA